MTTAMKLELSKQLTRKWRALDANYHFNKNLSRESKSALSQKLTQTIDNHTELRPAWPANHEYRISGSTPQMGGWREGVLCTTCHALMQLFHGMPNLQILECIPLDYHSQICGAWIFLVGWLESHPSCPPESHPPLVINVPRLSHYSQLFH